MFSPECEHILSECEQDGRAILTECELEPVRCLCADAVMFLSRYSYWSEVEPQLCIFHVIKEVNKLLLDGVRAIKNRLKRQGNKGRKKG